MACGKPVIASRVGQIEAVIDHGVDGMLVSNTAEDVMAKILELQATRERLPQMGERARSKVLRRYNWERVADATLDVFKSLVPASSAS
jgi:glycosyltransferase involved in cell wall biosynthesis